MTDLSSAEETEGAEDATEEDVKDSATDGAAPSRAVERPASVKRMGAAPKGVPGLKNYIFKRRGGGTFLSQPSFTLIDEDTNQVLFIARKKKARSMNTHIFAVTGLATASAEALKATEKVAAVLMAAHDLSEYRLVIDDSGAVEIAGASFDKTSIFTDLMQGFQPRRLSAIVPLLDSATHLPVPHNTASGGTSLTSHLRANDVEQNRSFHVLRTKEPVFQDGCFRLNFCGRAPITSVKNFQVLVYYGISTPFTF